MEQLIIPTIAISVDLVEGKPMVREDGEATMNVLESINLPPLSLPIFGSGQALVDGGLLNIIPANVLVDKGCNFVILSSVTAAGKGLYRNSFQGTSARQSFPTHNPSDCAAEHDSTPQHECGWSAACRFCHRTRCNFF
jgi:predicted acylesterase/phospholipase RssA